MKRSLVFMNKNILHNLRNAINNNQHVQGYQIRSLNSQDEVERRSELFSLEQKRQMEAVGRIEKIEVKCITEKGDTTLVMNKEISTPYDCARHLGAVYMDRSALALIDGSTQWDMHRPLAGSCTLQLQHFMQAEPQQVNRAFWRTCSFALGAAVSIAFKKNVDVKLHSFPTPDVRSGSFVYDTELRGLEDWQPSSVELRTLSAELIKLARAGARLERLAAAPELALEMFRDNEHKSKQIPDIASKSEGVVTLYRAGKHVDISKGPMVGSLSFISRGTVAAVHRLPGPLLLHRFQGVALPGGFSLNHIAYGILEQRAARQNPARSPFEPFASESEDSRASRAVA